MNTEGMYRFNLDWMLWLFLVQNFSVLQFLCGTCAGFVATNLIGRKEVYVENTVRENCLMAPVRVWVGT